MKAARLHKEGGLEQLVHEDALKPRLGARDALIRVHATGTLASPSEERRGGQQRGCAVNRGDDGEAAQQGAWMMT